MRQEGVVELAKSGSKPAQALLTANALYGLIGAAFALVAALVAVAAGHDVRAGLIVVTAFVYPPAHRAAEMAFALNRIQKNVAGEVVGVLTLTSQVLLAGPSTLVLVGAGVVIAAHLVNWALWLRYYSLFTSCELRTGKVLSE